VNGDEQAEGIAWIMKKFRCSKETAYRMVRTGEIPAFKMRGRWKVFPSKVIAHLEAPVDAWAQSARAKRRAS